MQNYNNTLVKLYNNPNSKPERNAEIYALVFKYKSQGVKSNKAAFRLISNSNPKHFGTEKNVANKFYTHQKKLKSLKKQGGDK